MRRRPHRPGKRDVAAPDSVRAGFVWIQTHAALGGILCLLRI
jgi:hypothetical protein